MNRLHLFSQGGALRRAGAVPALLVSLAAVPVLAITPRPAPPQTQPVAVTNATVHVGDGTVREGVTVAFADGRITHVGPDVDTTGARVIDARGHHVYPGFILPDSRLGLVEVDALRATIDQDETGAVNPNVRALVAYNTDSEMGPTLRFNGVLLAQVAPEGGLVSGTSSIVQLDAWNWEDAAVLADDGLFLNWPAQRVRRFDYSTYTVKYEKNKDYDRTMLALETIFRDAVTYADRPPGTPVNLKLAAMQGLFDGSKRLFVRTNVARDAVRAVEFAREHGVEHVVLIGADGLLAAADYLAEHEVGVIVAGTHRLPRQPHHEIHRPFRLASALMAHGVQTGLTDTGLRNSRNLPFQAATQAAWGGLDREQALQMITLTNAQLLGIHARVGSVEVGKDATLFISTGDALDMRSNDVTHAFINGRQITLPAMQQELYQRFRRRYADGGATMR